MSSDTRKTVFLSYASEDKEAALRIATALRQSGIGVWFDDWEIQPGDSLAAHVASTIAAKDVLVILLSRASVGSPWLRQEIMPVLNRDLSSRAITVIPAVLDDSDVPPELARYGSVDLRDIPMGIQSLVQQLGEVPRIDFSVLDYRRFEQLVADLLIARSFSVQLSSVTRDLGFDMLASYRTRDPFGAEHDEVWVVEVKYYRDQRVSINTLRQALGLLMTSEKASRGLVVTNGHLTSVARRFLHESSRRYGFQLRVIDGAELTRLLLQHPVLVERYFGKALPSE